MGVGEVRCERHLQAALEYVSQVNLALENGASLTYPEQADLAGAPAVLP